MLLNDISQTHGHGFHGFYSVKMFSNLINASLRSILFLIFLIWMEHWSILILKIKLSKQKTITLITYLVGTKKDKPLCMYRRLMKV